mgnify:CR=1 FL=1
MFFPISCSCKCEFPENIENEELNSLLSTIKNQGEEIESLQKELDKLKKNACDEQGTVETLEYDTPAYAVNEILGTDETIHKSLHVYLPYNYDETKQYNILYLMHGGGGQSGVLARG